MLFDFIPYPSGCCRIIFETASGIIRANPPMLGHFLFVYMFTTILPLMRSSLKFVRYEKYGLLEHWSRITRAFNFRKGWINRFSVHCAEAIKSAIPSGASYIRIASPTANYGDYEAVIAAAAAARCGVPVYMLASDISTTPHVSDFENDNVIYQYRENVNAWHLAEVLADRVHALLDLKGMLWHELNSLTGLKKKAEKYCSIIMIFSSQMVLS